MKKIICLLVVVLGCLFVVENILAQVETKDSSSYVVKDDLRAMGLLAPIELRKLNSTGFRILSGVYLWREWSFGQDCLKFSWGRNSRESLTTIIPSWMFVFVIDNNKTSPVLVLNFSKKFLSTQISPRSLKLELGNPNEILMNKDFWNLKVFSVTVYMSEKDQRAERFLSELPKVK